MRHEETGEGMTYTGYMVAIIEAARAEGAAAERARLDPYDPDHLVLLGRTTFSIQHPISEREHGLLFHCPLDTYLREGDGPPRPPGWYRVTPDGVWTETEAPK